MVLKRSSVVLVGLLLANLLTAATPADMALAAPAAQGVNLLNSPGFEGAMGGQGTDSAWAAWHQDISCVSPKPADFNYACKPHWSIESNPDLVHSGNQSQVVWNSYDPWHGGVMQTVNAPAGSTVRLTAWGRARSSSEHYPVPSDGANARMQVGIDPNGNGLWYEGVIWSAAINPHGAWQPVSLEATAGAAGKVTVYLSADYRGSSRLHLDVWWDDATLEVITPPTATPAPVPTAPPPPPVTNTPVPTPTPQPTATPVDTPTPTNTPEPTPTPTPATGTICVLAFDDGNRNGVRDGIEGPISRVTITLFDGQAIVATQTSNALQGQNCFPGLLPGPYQVFQSMPSNRQMTTADSVPVELQGGQSVLVLFGSTAAAPAATRAPQEPTSPTPVASESEPEQDTGRGLGEAFFAISGIIVLLLAAVLIGIFIIFRSR